jgi:DNA polymerase III subunit chi
MTQIDFYTHVPDKLQAACQILGRAFEVQSRVFVFAPDAHVADTLDRLLWTSPAIGFVPHCRGRDSVAAETPIVIDHEASAAHDDVLLNLHSEWPPFFARFKRLIEIVGIDDNDRLPARERFRFYRDRGYQIKTFNAANGESPP